MLPMHGLVLKMMLSIALCIFIQTKVYNFSFNGVGNTLSSILLINLFVCSAKLSVNMVCGNILARCAKKPLYIAKTPSVLMVLYKQSKTPL